MQCLIVLDSKASRRRRPVQSTQTKTKQNKASYKYLVYRCGNWFSRIMHIFSLVNTCTVSKDRPIWIAEHKLWSSGFNESQQVYLGHKNKFKFRAGFFLCLHIHWLSPRHLCFNPFLSFKTQSSTKLYRRHHRKSFILDHIKFMFS